MIESYSFQARARTVDHLGRGQIADAPTAVSELWKNAYDAYARSVALHIFGGSPGIGLVVDDGIGMDIHEVINKWLVLGTDSKLHAQEGAPEASGLPARTRQGEKGIGRLSAAFLAPVCVLMSRKSDGQFVVVVVDWRLFENPFLTLEDIRLPVATFTDPGDLASGVLAMGKSLLENLGDEDSDRGRRLSRAWQDCSNLTGPSSEGLSNLDSSIRKCWENFPLQPYHLEQWPPFLQLGEHGTALYLIDVHHELNVWVNPSEKNDEIDLVKERLRETLTAFTDPFADKRSNFNYEVWCHPPQGENQRVIASDDVFGTDDLHGLEHYIEGAFNDDGVFTGRVVAFGVDLGTISYQAKQRFSGARDGGLGRFDFCIGTFEVDLRKSTHAEGQHAILAEKAERFGGIRVYRDGLRIMPYGREDADFLGIEYRRSKHAGRYFWAHRRSFGRIAFTGGANPNLKDKAGREGLVDNKARRVLRILVVDLLVDFASDYFGTDSSYRKEILPEVMATKAAAKAAAEKAKTGRRKGLRIFLKERSPELTLAVQRARSVCSLAERVIENLDPIEATVMQARLRELIHGKDDFRLPASPSNLGELEESYRSYRDAYSEFVGILDNATRLAAKVDERVSIASPTESLSAKINAQGSILDFKLASYQKGIEDRSQEMLDRWREIVVSDSARFRELVAAAIPAQVDGGALLHWLNYLDTLRQELEEEFATKYLPLLRTLNSLAEGIELGSALDHADEEREDLQERLKNLESVAQVGVTVEIIGHELEHLEIAVRQGLAKLPAECRAHQAYKLALDAHYALSDRLKFLSPMKIGGYRARESIKGERITGYISEFFGRTFTEMNIDFATTSAFDNMVVRDLPSRIFPVFLNLVNNAVYWLSQVQDRLVRIDFVDGLVVVADSGPGIDPDDVQKLFRLFFSRRQQGRGVGLYLTRANLETAGHSIRFATKSDPHLLSGANFVISFKGVK